jgi:hypothetical protein
MATTNEDLYPPLTYGQEMGNVGGALARGAGAVARFIFNYPGGGGPLDANRLTAAQAVAPAITPPPAVGTMTSGGPDRVGGAQAMPTASTVAQPRAAAPAKSRSAASPAAAPAAEALIPGETGFYMGNQLVPYGTRFGMDGAGNVTQLSGPGGAGPAPGGGGAAYASGGGLIDPRAYFSEMVRAQMNFADAAADRILSQAGNGHQLGYSARLRALTSAYNNGLAQVGQGGANTFNSVTGQMENTRVDAAMRDITSQRALTGDLARAGATVRAAELGANSQDYAHTLLDDRFYATPQPTGVQMLPVWAAFHRRSRRTASRSAKPAACPRRSRRPARNRRTATAGSHPAPTVRRFRSSSRTASGSRTPRENKWLLKSTRARSSISAPSTRAPW